MESDIVSGQQSAWVLLKKLGEGDAGEVYLVESLLEKQEAILKRPGRSVFASDMIRQTAQITAEGKILKALSGYLDLEPGLGVRVPHLMDQSKAGTAFSDRLFIIIERATGFALNDLARVSKMGAISGAENSIESVELRRFIQVISESGEGCFSNRIVLQVLYTLLETFDQVHAHPFDMDGLPVDGILWNDVKPDHLYWDPLRAKLTIIDWGNGQFLERDGTTKDRRFTAWEDYRQWLEGMGNFLETYAGGLYASLEWPRGANSASLEAIPALKERIWRALQVELEGLQAARRMELDLLRSGNSELSSMHNPLQELEEIHRKIISYGELPDFAGELHFALSCAAYFARQQLMEEVREVCDWAATMPGSQAEGLQLTGFLAKLASHSVDPQQRRAFADAVEASLQSNWGNVLWDLTIAMKDSPEPEWWYELVTALRRLALPAATPDAQPLLLARRIYFTLQSMCNQLQDHPESVDGAALQRLIQLTAHLRTDIIPGWVQTDPSPPYASLMYQDVEDILPEISAFLPEPGLALEEALQLPRQQVKEVLGEWGQGHFREAAAGLRSLLLTDPERRRVFQAEEALLTAPHWLARAQRGPQADEHYLHFITDVEFEGRQLRNQIGPAVWMDLILEGCRQLRKGAWPADLFTSLPRLVEELPWLRRFERAEKLPGYVAPPSFVGLPGVVKGKLGIEGDVVMLAPLDAWIPEARGSSARVYGGQIRDAQMNLTPAALKLMRMDKIDYALPLFREEVLVMNAMLGVAGVTPLFECGFLKLDGDSRYPTGEPGEALPAGHVIRIAPNAYAEFNYQLEGRIADGWTPYLAEEQRDPSTNLLALCDASFTAGNFLPVEDLLQISIQIADLLTTAHERNVVYRDHKILHYYWLEEIRGIYSIDWNVARLHPEGLSDYEKQMDLVQFGARALHHILTGRTAPGALPLGPTRPEEIEQSAKEYQAQWTYDDQRLPESVRGLLERALAAEYTRAADLRDDLKQTFLHLFD